MKSFITLLEELDQLDPDVGELYRTGADREDIIKWKAQTL